MSSSIAGPNASLFSVRQPDTTHRMFVPLERLYVSCELCLIVYAPGYRKLPPRSSPWGISTMPNFSATSGTWCRQAAPIPPQVSAVQPSPFQCPLPHYTTAHHIPRPYSSNWVSTAIDTGTQTMLWTLTGFLFSPYTRVPSIKEATAPNQFSPIHSTYRPIWFTGSHAGETFDSICSCHG